MVKYAEADKIMEQPLEMSKIALDELHVKVDNEQALFPYPFYSPERRASIEGLYFFCWDKASNKMLYERPFPSVKRSAGGKRRGHIKQHLMILSGTLFSVVMEVSR